MQRYKMTLSYDGTNYSGWQVQPNAPSIQQTVQEAIVKLSLHSSPVVIGSGRTDAGVHALGQVAHVDLPVLIEEEKLQYKLNAVLPMDIRVRGVEKSLKDFHAQISAKGKEYHYHLHLDAVLDPFKRNYCWHLFREVDLSLLEQGTQLFIGTKDFTSFANEPGSGSVAKNPIRTIERISVVEEKGGVRLEFYGNGFLYKMVRNIVGTLLQVASHRCTLAEVEHILMAKDRRAAYMAAPPTGLFLVKVDYAERDSTVGC